MSDFDKDYAHFQTASSAAKPANFDDFERLDDFPIHEQPEAEALAETGSASASAEFDELKFAQNFGGISFGLHSTDRPLVTAEEPLPPVAVSPGPVTESAEIHLTPDPEECKTEPFIDITAGHVGGIPGGFDPDEFDPLPPARPSAPEQSLFDPYAYREEEEEEEEEGAATTPRETVYLQEEETSSHRETSTFELHHFTEEIVEREISGLSKLQTGVAKEPQPTIAVCPPKMEEEMLVEPEEVQEERVEKKENYAEEKEKRVVEEEKELQQGDEERKCAFHPRAWFNPSKIDPRVADLIYWRDVKKSGAVFGSGLVVLLSLTYFSFISVVSYLLLGVMTGTLSYRIYKNVLQAVQKSGEGHPFKEYLEYELSLPKEKVQNGAEVTIKHLECTAKELRRLFLVEDLVDSLKFAVMLWCFTYIGAWFNGLTLFIMAFVSLFTLPKVYETYQAQIDVYLNIACTQISNIVNTVKAKLPVGKKPKQQ